MLRMLPLVLALGAAVPAFAQTPAQPSGQAAIAAPSDAISLSNGMDVRSSDGVVVAQTHIGPDETFTGDDSFLTIAANPYQLRRIYPREAYVEGGVVRLRLTAAQFRARRQNPPPGV